MRAGGAGFAGGPEAGVSTKVSTDSTVEFGVSGYALQHVSGNRARTAL
jgi:hypothetical protein